MTRAITFAIKLAIIGWGFAGYLLAVGMGLVYLDTDSFANQTGVFILLVYGSVLFAGLISLFSSRVASALLCASTIAAFGLAFSARSVGHGVNTPESWLLDIAIWPGLVCVVLFVVSRVERRVPRAATIPRS
jgi:hypothetical protein